MITAIVQARMNSTRLPGKVLRLMGHQPMLWHVVRRAQACRMIDEVIIATTAQPEDDAIETVAIEMAVQCIRLTKIQPDGSNDVLARFATVAERCHASTHFVRLTGDCPLWCPLLGAEVITAHLVYQSMITSNITPANGLLRPMIDGFDTEVFTKGTLLKAHRLATDVYDRQHVTPFMYRVWPQHWLDHRPQVGGLKLSVDTQEDFDRCARLIAALPDGPDSFHETRLLFASLKGATA